MACNPTRIELSNSAATTMIVTLATDPGDGSTVSFEVDGLGIDDSATTSSGVATFTIDAQAGQPNFSLWDATLQVESNAPADAVVMIVETNEAQNIGVQLDDTDVSYCAPLDAGSSGTVTNVTGTTPISVANGTTTPAVSLDDDGIITAKIADAAVTSSKIADGAVTNGKIADLAIQHGKIADGAIVTSKIADDAVTADKIADGVLNDGTVTSVTAGSGLTGGTITSTGTIAHGPGTFIGSEEYPVKIVVDSFGHIQVNESESTAADYRNAVGANDAANLTTGVLDVARVPDLATSKITTGVFADSFVDLRVDSGATFDGQGSVITSAESVLVPIERSGTIKAASLVADASGSLTITLSRYTPTGGSLGFATSLGTIALSSAQFARDTSLSGWSNTTVSAGDVVQFTTGGTIATVTRSTVKIKIEES